MIHESYPWKEDLLDRKEQILRYNCPAELKKDDDSIEEAAYTYIEKGVFYSAFIIRKLIDCKSKLSDEADKYAIKVKVYKAKKQFDIYNRYIDEESHEWQNPTTKTVQGKDACNWLIHSFFFFMLYDDRVNQYESFYVASDFDRNKCLYEIALSDWLDYIEFIATDEIVRLEMRRDDKTGERIYTRKQRGKMIFADNIESLTETNE